MSVIDELKPALEAAIQKTGALAEHGALGYWLLHMAAGISLTVADALGVPRERAMERFVVRARETISAVNAKQPRRFDA